MSYPSYPEYKESGVEWFGEIPQHWEIKPLKWELIRNDGGVWGEDPTGDNDAIVLRSTDQTVDGQWNVHDPAKRSLSKREEYSTKLHEADLVVTKSSGSSLHIGKTTLVTKEIESFGACFGNFMQRLRTSHSCHPKLIWYFLNNQIARLQLDLLSNSTTGLANLNGTLIGEVMFATPPKEEQPQIARFLDHQTARIDALIAEQQRLIQLLKEKRQAVISHAVTKGLDPDVAMEDSGVEWLGEVPAHWNVQRLKYVSPHITVGIVVEPSKYYVDAGVPALRSLNVMQGEISPENLVYISEEANEMHHKSKVFKGDLVAVRSGQPGTTAVVPVELDGANCIDLIIIRKPKNCSEWFLSWFLASDDAVRQFSMGSGGAIQQHFNISTAMNLVVPVPGKEEQERIVGFIERETSRLDQMSVKAEQTMAFLEERRSALISAAVTGKIDVRDWQPSSSEAFAGASVMEGATA